MAVNNVNYRNLKQTPIPVVPRTMKIVNPDGTVSRSGQLLLEQLQAPSVTEGTHANRPDPLSVADGALYVESDRGVVYYNDGGVWKYLAGTMYGTIVPDQRPTDLGKNDGGFIFRSTDYGRQFVWNGTAWIEATEVRWGSHAGRLALVLTHVIDAEVFVESDRGNVMYQNQGGAWRYIGGTMYGTVSPTDQRPTDLGSQDTNFDFRTTGKPAHEFVWSGTAWIEVGADYSANGTVIGTRPALNVIAGSNVTISGVDNAVSDRVDVTISAAVGTGGAVSSVFGRTGAVVATSTDYSAYYVPVTRQVLAGTGMTGGGALSADVTLTARAMGASGASHSVGIVPDPGATAGTTRYLREDASWTAPPAGMSDPTTTKGDLIAHGTTTTRLGVGTDGQLLTADSTQTLGVKWAAPMQLVLGAQASASLTLTTTAQDVPGCSLTLNALGHYSIVAFLDFNLSGAGDLGWVMIGALIAAGTDQGAHAFYSSANATGNTSGRATSGQQWIYNNTAAGTIAKLQSWKNGGTGASFISTHTTIIATLVSP